MKRTKNSKIILLCILAIFIYVLPFICMFLFAIFFDGEKKFEIKDNLVEISGGKLIVENVNGFYDEEYKTYYIVGYLKNKTKDEYRNIDIEYRVYDEENNILGNTDFTYLECLDEGETWKFKIMYTDIDASDVHHFEFYRIEYD